MSADCAAGTILQPEIPYGRFERRVLLPHADYGGAMFIALAPLFLDQPARNRKDLEEVPERALQGVIDLAPGQ